MTLDDRRAASQAPLNGADRSNHADLVESRTRVIDVPIPSLASTKAREGPRHLALAKKRCRRRGHKLARPWSGGRMPSSLLERLGGHEWGARPCFHRVKMPTEIDPENVSGTGQDEGEPVKPRIVIVWS